MKRRNFAVIGRNFVVDTFFEAAAERDDVHLLGVYSRLESTARAFAEKHGADRVYTDLSVLASDGDLDFVYVASPNVCHEPQTVALLRGGRHVLVEKPAAPTRDGFARMCKAADDSGRILMEAMMPAHMPALSKVREWLPRIAPVRTAHFSYCQYSSRYDKFKAGIVENAFDPTLGNGALMDIGIYCVHWLAALFGVPDSLCGTCTFLPHSIDGAGMFCARFGETLCSVSYSKISDGTLPCEIQGEGGVIRIDRASRPRSAELRLRDGTVERFETADAHTDMYYELTDFLALLDGADALPFRRMTRDALTITDLAREAMGVDFQKE
ncbi:MAG: Gfo/Idh/MocA family oxidoreductase [Clostridia bacterium]|nr:Gfo/Idh/MocA family oxidoreductase [Clostridia bacterium]